MDLEELTKEDIFGLTTQQREELIKQSALIYIRQSELGATLCDVDFLSFLKRTIEETKIKIQAYEEADEFELCFFLTEVVKKIEEEYDGLFV